VALFRPWQPRVDVPFSVPPQDPIAHLAIASGPVEMRPASQTAFHGCPEGSAIGWGSTVRTGPDARCEIALDVGSALRLDHNTEVNLHKLEVVEVNQGRLWSTLAAGGEGWNIEAFGCPLVAKEPAEVALECKSDAARLIVVDGKVDVQTNGKSVEVGAGQQLRIAPGQVDSQPESCEPLLETAWVNKLIALRNAEHPELIERVNQLLANIGASKLSVLYEDELRLLGDAGVPPLLAYLTSTRNTPAITQRATAARIMADVAESRWIPDMIGLLTDPNADVRVHAAHGLERLTGRDQGLAAQAWRAESWASCEPAHTKWLAWWIENRDRYPSARRDVPAQASSPF
jgi:hypothetical protein